MLYNRSLFFIYFIYNTVYMSIPVSQFIPSPSSPRNLKFIFYICSSISILWISSFVLFFNIPHISELCTLNSLFTIFSSVTQLCPALCDPMDCSTPGLPVHHQLPEFTQTHVHWVNDAIQLSHTLSSPSPPAFILSHHQGLFKWVSSSNQGAKVLEIQLQHLQMGKTEAHRH